MTYLKSFIGIRISAVSIVHRLLRIAAILAAVGILPSISPHAWAAATGKPVIVGFDGEYSVKESMSAQAIEAGIRIAIHEINAAGGVLGGRPVVLKTLDNHSVPARGIANIRKFAEIEDLVAVFGGRYSPVQLQQLQTVHDLKIPLLDVWAAADGITDNGYKPNFVFRLSLRDAWAIPAMLNHAVGRGFKRIGVLLPNNGWGRSSQSALEMAIADTGGLEVVEPQWYNWGDTDILKHYEALLAAGAEALLFVANDAEASVLVRQLGERQDIRRIPIVSHWGVTGGYMVRRSGPALQELDFVFVQTFSFRKVKPRDLDTFMATAKDVAGYTSPESIRAPVGVGHAYDMMHILAKAVNLAGNTDRVAVRDALERVENHKGIVREYAPPFTAGRHDALSSEQVFMARFEANGSIVPIE